MGQLNIIVADDHPLYRSGVIDAVSKMPNIRVVAHAENGMKAYQEIIALRPDIAILDIEMPILSGLDVAKKVLGEKHQTRIILLTMHKTKIFSRMPCNRGFRVICSKTTPLRSCWSALYQLIKAIPL
ncbi:MAG: response regulator transcription factor [Saprospiraceae bacterium]|nr:response regulator transcription factor [Saprospiraceae bacterium]